MKTPRYLGLRLLLAVAGIFFALGIVEISFRILNIGYESTPPAECSSLREKMVASYAYSGLHGFYPPNSTHVICTEEFKISYTMDTLGYLGTGASDPSRRDLLVIGDSFAFGFGVNPEEGFAHRLNAYNAGIWGWPFSVHVKAFTQTVEVISPKRVLWVITPEHLFSEIGGNAISIIDPAQFPIRAKVADLYNATRISTFIWDTLGLGVNRGNPARRYAIYDKQDTWLEPAYDSFEASVAQLVTIANTHGVQIIPVFMPTKQYLAFALEEKSPAPLFVTRSLDVNLAHKRMADIFNRYGIPYNSQIDLTDLFRSGSVSWHNLYYRMDAHLNTEGQKVVADYLRQKLLEIPAKP